MHTFRIPIAGLAGALFTFRSKRWSSGLPTSTLGISTTSGGSSAWLTVSGAAGFARCVAALSISAPMVP